MNGLVLIVDDEFGIVEALAGAFEDSGYRVMSAYNGTQALARLAEERPDLIVLDYMLPDRDGSRLRKLIAQDALARIPVILISGAEESTIQRAGVKYELFLRKPFRLVEILEAAQQLTGASAN